MTMIPCPECKKSISEHATSCPKCGYEPTEKDVEKGLEASILEPKIPCPQCLKLILQRTSSCNKCGHQLTEEERRKGKEESEKATNLVQGVFAAVACLSIVIVGGCLMSLSSSYDRERSWDSMNRTEQVEYIRAVDDSVKRHNDRIGQDAYNRTVRELNQ